MKAGPGDRFLLAILLAVTVAMMVILPIGGLSLWRLLDDPAFQGGPGRFRPAIPVIVLGGEFLLARRLRRGLAAFRGI